VPVLEAMRDQHDDPKIREFANTLLPEIEADDRILRSIAEKIGSGPSGAKQTGGWLLEKFARLKLGHTGPTDFEMFESLEQLALGIHGKLCLWKALQVAARLDSRRLEFELKTSSTAPGSSTIWWRARGSISRNLSVAGKLSVSSHAPIPTIDDGDQRARDQIVFEERKTNVFLPAVYRFRCSRFDESAYAHEHTFSQTQNALMHLRVAELRGQPKWKDRLEA
jgi:hypothetical protein